MITMHNKILPVALVAALLGGSVGALVMRKGDQQPETRVAGANLTSEAQPLNASQADALRFNDTLATEAGDKNDTLNVQNAAAADESCYREGFTDGFEAARNERGNGVARSNAAPERVVYRNAPARRTRAASSRASRTAYYDYQEPRKRSFWQKHRDKLTVAGGAGGGALIGGLLGGKKGALIGAATGGGGAAVYTYGIRKRNRRN
ncbi:MAG: hypothetical protein LC800_14805 [Acidobacteria bacterium]|nr:hypothetical protein [Acidobacteriota bacterium]